MTHRGFEPTPARLFVIGGHAEVCLPSPPVSKTMMTKPMTMTSGQWPETQDNQRHWWWRWNNYDESEQIDKNEPTSAIISRNSSSPASHSCWTSSPPGKKQNQTIFKKWTHIIIFCCFLLVWHCYLFQKKQDLQWRMIDDRRLVLYNSPN